MTLKIDTALASEWQVLHNSHEKYEHFSLMIKLFAIAITSIAIVFSFSWQLAFSLLTILWLQEGIWKTFQARTSARIETIEHTIANIEVNESKIEAFRFYSQWADNRPTAVVLIVSYIKNALKPTVIYPYLPLMLVLLFLPI